MLRDPMLRSSYNRACCTDHQNLHESPFYIFDPFSGLSNDHNYTFFRAQYTAWIFVPSSSVRRLPDFHVDFTTELVASLCSDGNFAVAIIHWITLTNFIPIYAGFQGFGLTSARKAFGYLVNAQNILQTQKVPRFLILTGISLETPLRLNGICQ